MRERLEDLGRVAAMLEMALGEDIFDLYTGRNKDYVDWFDSLTEENKETHLHSFIYGLSNLKDKLEAISTIANGDSYLDQ